MVKRQRKEYKSPLTSPEVYTEYRNERAKTSKLNKARSKSMEREVAAYLGGSRVPMSGAAAQWKGDCYVEFVNNPGKYLIECKMSAQRDVLNDGQIRIDFKWLPKMRKEAQLMNSKFAILVIKFHYFSGMYVFIHVDDLQLIIKRYTEFKEELVTILELPAKDISVKLDKTPRVGYTISRADILSLLKPAGFIKGGKVLTPDGEYALFTIEDFRRILEGA